MATRRRIKKRQLKEDKFITYTLRVSRFVQRHTREFTIGVIAIVLIVIALSVLVRTRRRATEAASGLLGQATLLYQGGQIEQAVARLQELTTKYGGTREGKVGWLQMGNLLLQQGEYDQAKDAFQRYLNVVSREERVLIASAKAGVAACLEGKGELVEAGDAYLRTAEEYSDVFLAPEFLMDAGRCFILAGEKERARGAYQQLIDQHAESRLVPDARLALAEIGS